MSASDNRCKQECKQVQKGVKSDSGDENASIPLGTVKPKEGGRAKRERK